MTVFKKLFLAKLFRLASVILLCSQLAISAAPLSQASEPYQEGDRATAERLTSEGKRLFQQSTEATLRDSIAKYEEALSIWRRLGARDEEARTLESLGDAHELLGEKPKVLDYNSRALAIWRALGRRPEEARALSEVALATYRLGDYQTALDYSNQALELARSLPGGNRLVEAAALNNLANIYADLGDYQTGIDYYTQVLQIYRALKNRHREAATLNNIGVLHRDLGDYQTALAYLNQALEIFLDDSPNTRGPANTLTNIGGIYVVLNEHERALEHFTRGLQIRRTIGDLYGQAHTLTNMGVMYARLGDRRQALDQLNEGLRLSREVGNRANEAAALYWIAAINRDAGNFADARQGIESALEIVESLRTRVAHQQLRASYLAKTQMYYEFYVDLLMRINERAPSESLLAAAFEATERGRARSLLDLLAEARAEIREGADPLWLERERELRDRLNEAELNRQQVLSGKHATAQAEDAERRVKQALLQLQEAEAQVRARSARYTALTQPKPATIKQVQQGALDADTLLLEYALGDERSTLWLVSQTAVKSFLLPRRSEIEAAARRFHQLLSRRPADEGTASGTSTRNLEADLRAAASQLSQMLLAPAAAELGTKRLLIVADGALQYVPFAALPGVSGRGSVVGEKTRQPQEQRQQRDTTANPSTGASASRRPTTDHRPPTTDHRPLLADHEIVSLPSASTLLALRQEGRGKAEGVRRVAVFADPVFDVEDARVKSRSAQAGATDAGGKPGSAKVAPLQERKIERAMREAGLTGGAKSLPRLIGTRKEAASILAAVPEVERKQAFDFDANLKTATGADLSRYGVLHFATHGLLDSQRPELSGLVLSLVNEKGQPQNGYLRLSDIFNLKLSAELVVLSACQTGLGKEVRGEGLVGLTRGFMYAGSPRVVASLWKVDDRATAELMGRFYRAMLGPERLRPAAALRTAQLELVKQKRWQSPYFWAAFVLQGEWK